MRSVALLFVASVIALAGCSKKVEQPSAKSGDTTRVTTPLPKPRDAIFDAQFLARQANRAKEVRQQLTKLKRSGPANHEEIRKLIVKRKGEIIFVQKDIRNHSMLLPAEKDSLMAPLDSESIELAEELIVLDK